MTPEELRQYLRFYLDLGVNEIYIRQAAGRDAKAAAASAGAPTGAEDGKISAAEADLAPVSAAAASIPAPAVLTMPPRSAAPSAPVTKPAPPVPELPPLAPSGDSLALIQQDIGDCRRCRLCEGRSKIVFGSGNQQARLVFVGEGPGADEDAQGLPFVGRAGQLLTQMIDNTAAKEGIPIRRPDVYICNVVKCRPPGNRTPLPDEMEICGAFLYRQLMVLRPKAICALGSTAAKALLNAKDGVTRLRGNWHKWRDIPVMVTYHPSYLLRPYNQNAKREAWEDLKKVLHFVYD
jgi:uracil-DNA glycosylase family 4